MKALVLVGGYGTRLRPLTLSVPKPLIDFCNKSIVEHQIAALKKAGVNHVILAVAYQVATMLDALRQLEVKYDIRISISKEDQPLGTAGPIALAKDLLLDGDDPNQSFFVCNSDVICNFPYEQLLAAHNRTDAQATILVTKVKDPSAYGVVVHNPETGQVSEFVEKSKEFVGDCINAGLYVIRATIFDMIKPVPTSIEKEVFPAIARAGKLYCEKLDSYWADIGQPREFLNGMCLYLEDLKTNTDSEAPRLETGPSIIGNVIIDPSAKIGAGTVLGPNVTIGADCVVGEGCRIANSAVMRGVSVGSYSWLNEVIVGWNSAVGKWVRIEGLTVVGEDVRIIDECYVNGALILPHKSITSSITAPGSIIM